MTTGLLSGCEQRSGTRARIRPRTLWAVLLGVLAVLLLVVVPAIAPRVRHRLAVETVRRNNAWTLFDDAKAQAKARRTSNYQTWNQAQGNWWLDVVEVHFGQDSDIYGSIHALPDLIGLKGFEFGRGVSGAAVERLFAEIPPMSLDLVSFFDSGGTDQALAALKRAKRVTQVFGNTAEFTDRGLESLADVRGLRILGLVEEDRKTKNPDRFSERGFAAIGKLTSLDHLDLRGYRISDASLEKLHSLKNLSKLIICYSQVSSTAIEKLRKALPQCQVVSVDNWEPGETPPNWFRAMGAGRLCTLIRTCT